MRGWVILSFVVLMACGAKQTPEPSPTAAKTAVPEAPPLPPEAEAKVREAVAIHDDGRPEEAAKLLAQLLEQHPKHPTIAHELALSYLGGKKPQDAIAVLDTIRGTPHFNDEHYALYASALDMQEKYKESLAMANEGIRKFPTLGRLYTNAGVTSLRLRDDGGALRYFEDGIENAPAHASNYYWAAKMLATSSQKPWGLIYGEMFLNIEPGGERAEEMSALLYQAIDEAIVIDGKGMKVGLIDKGSPFEVTYEVFFGTALAAAIGKNNSSKGLAPFVAARESFIKVLSELAAAKETPEGFAHPLFEFQKAVMNAGHFEAYSYWLLGNGNKADLIDWGTKRRAAYDAFVKWFPEHRLGNGAAKASRPR